MNNLFRHIEFLLLRHDCVVVPGLGAFISTVVPAYIDRDKRRIFPPCRYVMFNQAVTVDDGLLANSYARSLSLSFEEARQIILKDVSDLIGQLHTEGNLQIGRLGKIILGEENNLQFLPSASPDVLSRQIGLSPLDLPDDNIQHSENNCYSKISEQSVSSYYHFKIDRKIFKFTAILALFIAVAVTIFINPIPRDSRELRASVVPVEVLIPTGKTQNSDIQISADQASIKVEENQNKEEILAENIPLLKHFMIVATFHSKQEAEKYVAYNSTPEFPLEIVTSRKLSRVSVASSDNKSELIKKLNSKIITQKFPNAWIWSQGI